MAEASDSATSIDDESMDASSSDTGRCDRTQTMEIDDDKSEGRAVEQSLENVERPLGVKSPTDATSIDDESMTDLHDTINAVSQTHVKSIYGASGVIKSIFGAQGQTQIGSSVNGISFRGGNFLRLSNDDQIMAEQIDYSDRTSTRTDSRSTQAWVDA
ncbi:MAG: hypothetical protein M1828_002981 [Chrysothrix sp. TS-e1954]|nr:MAG: hypothetical protein M1828_002981 [Chrysothrix sp. TS-e1954]